MYRQVSLSAVISGPIFYIASAGHALFWTLGASSFIIAESAGETLSGHDKAAAIFRIQYFNSSEMTEAQRVCLRPLPALAPGPQHA